jgi:hypothetical protein
MFTFPITMMSSDGSYTIENALWFDGSADYLTRTPGSAGNQQIWTLSWWQKKTWTGVSSPGFWGVGDLNFSSGNANDWIFYDNSDKINIQLSDASSGTDANMTSAMVDRDPTAWANWIIAVNTTLSTASQRVRVYRNGTEVTDFGSPTDPTQSISCRTNGTDQHVIGGGVTNSSNWWRGYLAEIIMVDGAQEVPADFGELDDNGVWVPINPSGLTYGDNGFLLQFKQNGSGQDENGIGADTSGENNHWAVGGGSIQTNQVTDTCTDDADNNVGNYLTLNPLNGHATPTISEGNTRWARVLGGANNQQCYTTFGANSGKFYFEFKLITANNGFDVGLFAEGEVDGNEGSGNTGYGVEGYYLENYGTGSHAWKVTKTPQATGGASRQDTNDTAASNDICKIAVDFDAGKIWLGSVTHNTYYNGSNGSDISFSTGSPTFTFTAGTRLFPYIFAHAQANDCKFFFNPAEWTGSAPSGFLPWTTAGLPAPTVTKPDDFFKTVLYTANNSDGHEISTVGFVPDFVWIKDRDTLASHVVFDVVRGVSPSSNNYLTVNTTDTENQGSFTNTMVQLGKAANGSTVINGFTLDDDSNDQRVNYGGSMVAWCWKAGGAASSNSDGNVTGGSSVSVASHNGFAIVTYGDCGGAAKTVGHGMGQAPEMIIVMCRNASRNRRVYHKDLTSEYVMYLDLTDGQASEVASFGTINASTFGVDGGSGTSANGETHVAYCFARTPGLIGIGKYTGNGVDDGPMVVVDDGGSGFKPAWLMVKRIEDGYAWHIQDSTRSPHNPTALGINANDTGGDSATTAYDFIANGFKLRAGSDGGYNGSGATYIYLAFAEHPFGGNTVAQAKAR